jgi:hypothetical protein
VNTTSTTAVSSLALLTGLPLGDPAKVNRPALIVKIENDQVARPQSGLDVADVVYEEVVEGGDTRFIAVFQSTDADPVGPIRSVRPTDRDVVWPIGGLFAYAGGTPKFVNLLHQAPVVDVGVDSRAEGAYHRRSNHPAPHNLYSSTPALYAAGGVSGPPPGRVFTFLAPGQPFAPAGAVPAVHLSVAPGHGETVDYDWDGAARVWKRSYGGRPHTVESGAQLAPTTVIVEFTPYSNSPGDFDQAHSPVPVAKVVGTGDAWVMADGKLVRGHWSKPTPDAVTVYTDAAGAPVSVPAGRTWVELADVGAPVSVR